MMRSAVIFDLFGTLVAGVSSHVQATFVSEAARVIAAPEDALRREWSTLTTGGLWEQSLTLRKRAHHREEGGSDGYATPGAGVARAAG